LKITILTMCPDLFRGFLTSHVVERARERGLGQVEILDIRPFAGGSFRHIDDSPFGGGRGLLLRPEPVMRAMEEAVRRGPSEGVVRAALVPAGLPYDQRTARDLSRCRHLILVCGRYEGMDARLYDRVDMRISLGDYVLTGGELPAMVFVDCISRLVPGVLHNDQSAVGETFADDLLEYPQYSRPEVWQDKAVPKVLLSGDHRKIAEYRLEQQIERTKERRPDLWEKARPQLREKLSNRLRRNLLGES
jgi:tRNA (guanine37-N1)-methyltransferase